MLPSHEVLKIPTTPREGLYLPEVAGNPYEVLEAGDLAMFGLMTFWAKPVRDGCWP
jgi:hypothetical protein